MLSCALLVASLNTSKPQPEIRPATIPIVVVNYFPKVGDMVDKSITGDVGGTYAALKAKCERLTNLTMASLDEGSRYHAYKDPTAKPSLHYVLAGSYEFNEGVPTLPKVGSEAPMTDYQSIMKRIDIAKWVEKKGVKEVWIWGYDGGKVRLFESNMSSPYGDVSNSSRDESDLPKLTKTYTVYHYNYGRALSESLEDHTHQIEALLNGADGRDTTPAEKWPDLLFWGKFVGSDESHKLVTTPLRCGWTHYAPNSEKDYDWANPRFVESDIEDWHPDAPGKTQRISSDRWAGDSVRWKIYWMQNIPGANNGLTYKGKALRNWWDFVSDWDLSRREKWTLTIP